MATLQSGGGLEALPMKPTCSERRAGSLADEGKNEHDLPMGRSLSAAEPEVCTVENEWSYLCT